MEDAAPVRRSALMEAADLLTEAVSRGVRTLAFVRSRRAAEVLASTVRQSLTEVAPELGDRVAAYRSGYLPEERRQLERALHRGELLGLATTNALELGVDLAGLDAVVLCGYPGRLASLWQQAGRAGRAGREALACSWRATTRSTRTWCTTRRRCSAHRWRRPCSTRQPLRTRAAPVLRPRPSCR